MDFNSFFNELSIININVDNYKDAYDCLNDNPGIDLICYSKEIKINNDDEIIFDGNEIDIANNFIIYNDDPIKIKIDLIVNEENMIFKNRKLIPMCCLKTPLKLRFKFLDEPYEIKIKYDIYLCQKRIKDKLRGISLIVDNINYKNDEAFII